MTAIALALVACDAGRIVAPSGTPSPLAPSAAAFALSATGPNDVRISEFHYDNSGTDVGEAIEISGPAGTDLAGWQVVRYNGAVPGAAVTYTGGGNPVLGGVIPAIASCGTRGVVTINYTQDGLQNGTADGFALVNPAGQVVELLSYEGVFTASNGPAAGMVSTDVGVSETGSETGTSIKRVWDAVAGTFSWQKSSPTNFGSCTDNGGIGVVAGPLATITVTPATASVIVGNSQAFTAKGFDAAGNTVPGFTPTWSTTSTGIVTVNATTGSVRGDAIGDAQIVATSGSITGSATLHVVAPPPPPSGVPSTRFSEIHYDNSGTDVNEGFEIEGDAGASIEGWSIVLHTGSTGLTYNTIPLHGTFTATCNGRGAISVPVAGIQNGGLDIPEPDGMALVNASGVLVEFLSYEGIFTAADGPAAGVTSTDIGVAEGSSASSTQSLQRNADGTWNRPAASTFGVVNACATGNTGTASISITANGPDTLVVGWQRRAFVTFRDANGTTVTPTPTITWTSDTPDIASVDPLGYATALKAGTAKIRATIGTTTNTYAIAVIDYQPVIATYRNHLEFGMPTGMDPNNSVLLTKPGYVTSYNPARGGPNWVSWNLNSTQFGDADRCECFSGDMALPDAQRITDQDYVNGGYDRGHMVQSESRTTTHSENASTFLLTNILPQAANNNQGPWLGFENYLNDFARTYHKEVYVVAGGEYSANPTTLKNAGRVAIPVYTWKVAVVMDAGKGLADVHSVADLQVIAIRIPNLLSTAPAKNNIWQPWVTVVDSIEAHTGLDLLAALPDNIERAVESNDRPPVAALTGATTGAEGSALTFSGGTSTDPDAGDVLTYDWTFSDGATASGVSATHTFADNGTYTVTLTVTDSHGVFDVASGTVTVANVAPTATLVAPASVNEGSSFTLALAALADASPVDVATLTVAFDCGTGTLSPPQPAAGATVTCATTDDDVRAVRAVVADKDGGSVTLTGTVTVTNVAPAVSAFGGASILRGEHYSAAGTFTDPGSDTFTATVDYGDATGPQPLALSGGTFALSHDYTTAGTFTVTVTVRDDDGGVTSSTAVVQVASAADAIGTLSGTVNALVTARTLNAGEGTALNASLRNASAALSRSNPSARRELEAFINKVEALNRSGRLDAATSGSLIAYARRVIDSIG